MKLAIIPLLFLGVLKAQEASSEEAKLSAPAPSALVAAKEAAPPTPVLEITSDEIISSRTLKRPDQTFTIQQVIPQEIQPLPSPPEWPNNARDYTDKTPAMPHRLTMVSCTVHHDDATSRIRTRLQWNSQGKIPVETYEAWSNIDFRHLTPITTFEKNNTRQNVMFGMMGYESSAKAAALAKRLGKNTTPLVIPELPDKPTETPTFAITRGNPEPVDLEVIEGLHELYAKHHAEFIAESERIAQVNAIAAAQLKANPPDPTPDVTIRFWFPDNLIGPPLDNASTATPSTEKGGEK